TLRGHASDLVGSRGQFNVDFRQLGQSLRKLGADQLQAQLANLQYSVKLRHQLSSARFSCVSVSLKVDCSIRSCRRNFSNESRQRRVLSPISSAPARYSPICTNVWIESYLASCAPASAASSRWVGSTTWR